MNAFLDLADRQISSPAKARQGAAEKRKHKAADDQGRLRLAWRRWHDERGEALLAGPHGDATRGLINFLGSMTIDQGAALVALVEAGPWRDVNADARFEILRLIDTAIIALRERHDLPPFDDLLSARPNVFLKIREALS
jgi:hypothetical protein